MDDDQIYIPDAVCSALRLVRAYVKCDCGSELCPYDTLLFAVSTQEEEQRKEREQAEADRQEAIRLQQQNQLE